MPVSSEILDQPFDHDDARKFVNAAAHHFRNGESSFARIFIDPRWREHRYRDEHGRFTGIDDATARVRQDLANLMAQRKLNWRVDAISLNITTDNNAHVARGFLLTATVD